MPTTSLPEIPVRSAPELTDRWAALLAPPVFAARSLWVAWLDPAGLMLPVVVPVDELPLLPDPATVRGLLALHDAVVESTGVSEGHLALALCRPGTPAITEDDDEWAEALRLDLDEQLDGTWSLHLATGGTVSELVQAPEWTWRAQHRHMSGPDAPEVARRATSNR